MVMRLAVVRVCHSISLLSGPYLDFLFISSRGLPFGILVLVNTRAKEFAWVLGCHSDLSHNPFSSLFSFWPATPLVRSLSSGFLPRTESCCIDPKKILSYRSYEPDKRKRCNMRLCNKNKCRITSLFGFGSVGLLPFCGVYKDEE